jgi:hypothetical protein
MAGKAGKVNRAPPKMPEFAQGASKAHEVNDTTRRFVQFLRVAGYTQVQIARVAGIDEGTLRKYYRDELDNAKARVDAQMANTLVMQGLGGGGADGWKNANIAANIFYHKVYMGKNERSQMVHSGAVGMFDLSKLTDEQLEQYERLLSIATVVDRSDAGGSEGGAPPASF